MKRITFYKVCGTGNDFVIVDNRREVVNDPISFSQRVCERHTGIGADGLILLEKSKETDLRMRIFNADGSEAEMCGNGMRCAAWVAHSILKLKKSLSFETLAGIIKTEVTDCIVKVELGSPTDFRDYAPIEVEDGIFYFYFINTGVPHCVIFEDSLEGFPVERIGREIRFHPHFQPAGTNVNFVQIQDANTIIVRTYERGVEAETLACGTGSTAAAIMSALVGKCKPPVTVITRSKEQLTIDFAAHKYDVSEVSLKGSVKYVFKGEIL